MTSDLNWAENLSAEDKKVVDDLMSEITHVTWKDSVAAQRLLAALELIKKLALQASDSQSSID